MSTVRGREGARPWRFGKKDYYRLGDLGFFRGRRVELIEGRLMVLSPQNAEHASAVDRVADVLRGVFGQGYWLRQQFPLDLGQTTEPEPDVCVVVGDRAQYVQAHPTSAVLIVEVSDTTLSYDRRRKGSLYARANIRDYWIINLVDQHLEVYCEPVSDPGAPFGFRYATRIDLVAPATVAPLTLPAASIPVADLLDG